MKTAIHKQDNKMLEVTNLGEHDILGFPMLIINVEEVTAAQARKHAKARAIKE